MREKSTEEQKAEEISFQKGTLPVYKAPSGDDIVSTNAVSSRGCFKTDNSCRSGFPSRMSVSACSCGRLPRKQKSQILELGRYWDRTQGFSANNGRSRSARIPTSEDGVENRTRCSGWSIICRKPAAVSSSHLQQDIQWQKSVDLVGNHVLHQESLPVCSFVAAGGDY